MILAGVFTTMSLALPALAGCVLISVTVELSEKYGFLVFSVVAVLSFFLTADKEAFVIYLLFFGYYPVLFSLLCKIKNIFLAYFIKFALFNVAAILDYVIITFILGIPMEYSESFGMWFLPALLLFANVIFVLYDRCLYGIVQIYFQRLHPIARRFIKK